MKNHGVWKFFVKLHLNFFYLDEDGYIRRGCCIVLFQNIAKIFACLKIVYTVLKSLKKPSIIRQCLTLHNRRTDGFKIDWYPPKLGTCCMLSREIPLCIRQASCMHRSALVTSIFRSSERTVVSSFWCNFPHVYHEKFEHFAENNYAISLTIVVRHPRHHSIKNAHFNNKFLPSLIGISSRNVDESVSANFGRL